MEAGPLGTIRKILVLGLLAGSSGTLLELLLIGHDEMTAQLAPLVLLGAGVLVAAWALVAPRPAAVRTLQLLMVVFIAYVRRRRGAAATAKKTSGPGPSPEQSWQPTP